MMTSFLSPYMALFVLLAVLIYPYQRLDEKRRRLVIIVCLLLLVAFFGLHGRVGDDYDIYLSYYEMPPLSLSKLLTFEVGFCAFTSFFKLLGFSFAFFLLVYACLINTLLVRFCIQMKENVPLMLCIFMATGGVASEMNFLRSTVALMLFVNSLVFLRDRKPLPFVLINAVGILFHYSSLLYLPCYFFLHRRIPPTVLWVVLAVAAIAFPFHLPFLEFIPPLADALGLESLQHFAQYVIVPGHHPLGFTTGLMERLLTAFAVCYFYDNLTKTPLQRIAVNAFVAYFLFYSLLSGYALLATRFGNMFVFAYWLLWPILLRQLDGWKRYAVAALMFLYMGLRIASIATHPQWHYVLYS